MGYLAEESPLSALTLRTLSSANTCSSRVRRARLVQYSKDIKMRSLRTAAAALALLGTPRALASPQESGDNSNDSDGQVVCAEGLYIVVARGTTEDETGGVTNPLAMEIMEQVPGSEIINLDYPATFTDPGYGDSQTEGAIQLQEVVLDYTSSCPDSKLAIMGYSQGAHASVDAVCGGYSWFNELEPLAVDLIEDNGELGEELSWTELTNQSSQSFFSATRHS